MSTSRARRRHGGSVRKLASGRWQVRVYDPAIGKHVAVGTFARKGDADAALTDAVAERQRGRWVDPAKGRARLGEFIDEWIEANPRLGPSTRDRYRGLARLHVRPYLGEAKLADLRTATVRRWHAELTEAASPATAAKAYRMVRAALNTAAADGLIAVNPCQVTGAGVERSAERPTATVDEIGKLADAVGDRWRAMVLLAAWCGLRLGELAALTRADVDLAAATVRVDKSRRRGDNGVVVLGPPKSDAGRRTVAMPRPLVAEVAAHLDRFTGPDPDALVFTGERGGAVERAHFNGVWQRARAQVDREDLRFHDLRHTGNTLAAATGASVAELMARMGHASPAAALRYQHATRDRDRVIADALGGLMAGEDTTARGGD